MEKRDQGSLTKSSGSAGVQQREMPLKGGRRKPDHNKRQSSEVGELKLKIRRLQRELAKANTVAKPAKVVNHLGLGVPLPGVSQLAIVPVETASSTGSTSHDIQKQPQKLNSWLHRSKPKMDKVGLEKPTVNKFLPSAPPAKRRAPQPPNLGVITAVVGPSATSGTSSVATGVMGSQELTPRMHRHKCDWCGKQYTHEHRHFKIAHKQFEGDCPYPECENHDARKVASNNGLPLLGMTPAPTTPVSSSKVVTATVTATVSTLTGRFLAPHNTGAKKERDDDPEVVKPVKKMVVEAISTMKNRGDVLQTIRRPQRVAPHYADCDLVHLLRLEYAFKPRTSNMLSQMAAKCKIYLAKYDCTELSAKQIYNMIISAVSAAMEISPLEEQVRQSLRNTEGNMARHKQSMMIRDGILGNKLFGAPDKLPSNK